MKYHFLLIPVMFLMLAGAVFADSKDDSIAFHGKRMSRSYDAFFVSEISTRGRILLVRFNVPIDPRTFTKSDAVSIDGKPLGGTERIRFDHEGKLVEITLDRPCSEESTITFSGITSFDGTKLSVSSYSGIVSGCRFMYAKPHQAEKKGD